jgi:hypothetical protein
MRSCVASFVLVLCACEGTASDIEVASATITLKSEGSALTLDSAPLKGSYSAQYPNPSSHQWMTVTLTSDAKLVVSCRSATPGVQCADSPIFVSVEGKAGARRVRAYDVFQQRLADLEYTAENCGMGITEGGPPNGTPGGTPSGTPGGTPSNPINEGPPAGGAGGGGASMGPSSVMIGLTGDPNVTTEVENPGDAVRDDSDEGAPTCMPPGATSCPPEAKTAFCDAVNAGLAQYALPLHYDCAHLDENLTFMPVLSGEVHCKRSITDPAARVTVNAYPGCSADAREWDNKAVAEIRESGMCGGSPLVLDLDGDGVQLSTLADGAQFDLFSTGHPQRSAWLSGGDGLLVMDRNHNGLIDDGSELFGEASFNQSWSDGFAALAQLDSNGDGKVDADDPAFGELHVWIDRDHDGRGTSDEWLSLRQAGVQALSTGYSRVLSRNAGDGRGNWIPLRSYYVRADGSRGQLVDAYFALER